MLKILLTYSKILKHPVFELRKTHEKSLREFTTEEKINKLINRAPKAQGFIFIVEKSCSQNCPCFSGQFVFSYFVSRVFFDLLCVGVHEASVFVLENGSDSRQ
jgi:hypothetical protein